MPTALNIEDSGLVLTYDPISSRIPIKWNCNRNKRY